MIVVPRSFRGMPRWWTESSAWLDALPGLVDQQCRQWGLVVDGAPRHGSNALVVPVRRRAERYALRLTPPDERAATETAALLFWAGRGTVEVIESAPGVCLLEWLDPDRPAGALPPEEASAVLGTMMRRLAVPLGGAEVPRTADMAQKRIVSMQDDWSALERPFPQMVLRDAAVAAEPLITITDDLAVDGDLHGDQVLAGVREPWLTVDPLLLGGDIAYDLARCLWTRLDDLVDDAMIMAQLVIMADAAGLDPERARCSAVFRTVDYWLWGLRHGLTEDPARCARLHAALTA